MDTILTLCTLLLLKLWTWSLLLWLNIFKKGVFQTRDSSFIKVYVNGSSQNILCLSMLVHNFMKKLYFSSMDPCSIIRNLMRWLAHRITSLILASHLSPVKVKKLWSNSSKYISDLLTFSNLIIHIIKAIIMMRITMNFWKWRGTTT